MKNNYVIFPQVWLCTVMLALVVSCQDGNSAKHTTQMFDYSLVFVVDNYPEEYKIQQTANAIPRSLVFVYKIKNNSSRPAYLPIHSDNATDRKIPSELSLFVDTIRIGSKTKVGNCQSGEEEAYVYDLSFNEYGNVVENRKKVSPYTHDEGLLHPGDSIFVGIRVADSLLKKAGLPSDINIYDLMERMQGKYIPDQEYKHHASHMMADVRLCNSRFVAFCFRMENPEIKKEPTPELQWKCNDNETDENKRYNHFFSGMSCYY